jgi:hypothetical protein
LSAEVPTAATVWTPKAFPFDYSNRIAPTKNDLRYRWLFGRYGTAAEFDAIPPAQ